MKKIYGESKLSINELNTLLAEVTNIVNERPIGVKPNSETDTEYLSPNCLLLGKNSSRICSGPILENDLYDKKPATMKTRFLDKKKEVTSHKPQVTSQEIGSHESQATSQDTGGGVTKMRSQ